MRRLSVLRVMFAGALISAMLPVAALGAGESLRSPHLEDLLTDELGFHPDQAPQWASGLVEVGNDWAAFAAGGDASVPATIGDDEARWTIPLEIGLNYVLWQDGSNLPAPAAPAVTNGTFSGGVNGGPQAGATYLVMTAVMTTEIPLGDLHDLSQFDFVLSVPGLDMWQADQAFPDDTWHYGSLVLSIRYESGNWAIEFISFPAGLITAQPLPGFAYISGDTILAGVEADPSVFALDEGAAVESLAIAGRLAQHHENAGSRVVTAPAAPFVNGGFFDYLGSPTVLTPDQVGPEATTATTVPETSTTTVTVDANGGDGGGFPWLVVLVVLVVLILGGLAFRAFWPWDPEPAFTDTSGQGWLWCAASSCRTKRGVGRDENDKRQVRIRAAHVTIKKTQKNKCPDGCSCVLFYRPKAGAKLVFVNDDQGWVPMKAGGKYLARCVKKA